MHSKTSESEHLELLNIYDHKLPNAEEKINTVVSSQTACEGWSHTDAIFSQRYSLQKLLGYQEIRHECKVSCVIFKVSMFCQL